MQINQRDIALIIVDVQNDFCEGGSLEVPNASLIIPKINKVKKLFRNIIFTKDWHPQNHTSFRSNHQNLESMAQEQLSNLWPIHCVQNSFGSEIHSKLVVGKNDLIVLKGENSDYDSYSGFGCDEDPTNLQKILNGLNVKKLFICGLALDYCVLYTAIDALKLGYQVYILEDCSQSIFPDQVRQKINQNFKNLQSLKNNIQDYQLQLIKSEQLLEILLS